MRTTTAGLAVVAAALIGVNACANAQETHFRDLEGHEVTIAHPVKRVVTLPIPSASTFIAIDGSPRRLVGIHPEARAAIRDGILGRIFPAARDIDSSITAGGADGFTPNVETIAMLDPDVVVQWGGRGDDIVAPLRNAGLTTALLLYGTESYARGNLTMLGAIAGKPARAQEFIAWRAATITDLEKKTAVLALAERPKVLYLQRALGALVAAGRNTYNDYTIRLAGGVNAAGSLSGALAVNAEQIAAWNPDVILLNGFETALSPAQIYANPILAATAAARSQRVYKMPLGGYRWDPPSQESPLTFMWLADLLHPKVFSYDLRAQILSAYRMLYGVGVSAADLDDVLRLRQNHGSRGYEVFASHPGAGQEDSGK